MKLNLISQIIVSTLVIVGVIIYVLWLRSNGTPIDTKVVLDITGIFIIVGTIFTILS